LIIEKPTAFYVVGFFVFKLKLREFARGIEAIRRSGAYSPTAARGKG
jgi:hypothetical protein